MNLHEECLLKYLLNPVNLFETTEMLKLNNDLIKKGCYSIGKTIKVVKANISASKF